MAELKLYNTLTRKKEIFTPIDPTNVRMYVCGPTVYDFAHIGNARPVIVFDMLYRLLRYLYPGPGTAADGSRVTYTRNITDVDDKINARAAEDFPDLPLNAAIRKVTEATNAQFQADAEALGCLEPTHQPRATDHIQGMRAIIEKLVARGFAYVAEGHVLFAPAAMDAAGGRLPRYGALANRSLDEMIAGARVDVAPYKKAPTDFVLWKPSKPGEPGWNSPAGIGPPGRPGWHIECSAMSMATLLEPFGGGLACDDPVKNMFDIHGGGIDLVFPHHENEIAQSCCAFGAPRMANYWMHNGFLQVEGQKMSKSLGNFVTIDDVLKDYPQMGDTVRLAMLLTHYRQPIDWTKSKLTEATVSLSSWEDLIFSARNGDGSEYFDDAASAPTTLVDALCDDLDLSAGLFELRALARHIKESSSTKERAVVASQLLAGLRLLGLDRDLILAPKEFSGGAKVQALITARLAARTAKNFAESDRIRDELVAMGIQIMDSKDPITGELKTTWEVKR